MSEAPPEPKTTGQLKNVLAVDNDAIMLKFLSRILEKAGLHVLTAKDGVTAIDILESYTPDLFFIDLVMPNIDGRELCRIIRSKKTFKTSPIVIVSAIAAEESIDTVELGANVCIAKVAYIKMEKMITKLLQNPQLLWDPTLGNRVLGVDDLSPRNITNELLTVNRHYRFMIDSISSGIIEFDQNRRVIYANPAALRIFSMPPEVMLGSHVDQLFNTKTDEPIFSLIHSSKPEGVLAGPGPVHQLLRRQARRGADRRPRGDRADRDLATRALVLADHRRAVGGNVGPREPEPCGTANCVTALDLG